jgi:Holliday junction resolvase
MEVEFSIPGQPQGKARARTVKNRYTGKIVSYTPEKTVEYEEFIRWCYMKETKVFFKNESLAVEIKAYFEPPKQTSRKNREKMLRGEIKPTKKPDADNIAKVVCDALNKVAYTDDTQICTLVVQKEYAEEARVLVRIIEER